MIRYEDINVDALYDQLDLKSLAVQNGLNNKPDSDDRDFDAPQQRVVQVFSDFVNEARRMTREESDKLLNQLDSIEIEIDSSRCEELPRQAEHDVENRLIQNKNDVKYLRKVEQAADRAYRAFRVTNDITRNPEYVDSRYLHWSIIAALLIGEAIANSYFFALGSNLGFLGGIWKSTLVSAVNIGVAVLIGTYVLPYKNKQSVSRNNFGFSIFNIKRLAYAALLFAGAIVVLFNLAVAHYRAQMDIDPENAITAAIPALVNDLFNIQSFEAWVLFILGVACSLFAGIKAYGHDDIYPGYGKVHRIYNRAKIEYQNAKDDLNDDCIEIINSYITKIDSARSEFQRLVRNYGTVLDIAASLETGYKDYIKQLEGQCNSVLNKYRSHNVGVRNSSSPAPGYFSVVFNFEPKEYEIDLPSLRSRDENRSKYSTELTKVGETAQIAREELRNQSRYFNQEINQFIKEIENEVEQEDEDEDVSEDNSMKKDKSTAEQA